MQLSSSSSPSLRLAAVDPAAVASPSSSNSNASSPSLIVEPFAAGQGRVAVEAHGSTTVFSRQSATYPLKLLSPRTVADNVAVLYVLAYGGGLVSGDRTDLVVDIGARCTLVMLTQGSTKVFKFRPDTHKANVATVSQVPSSGRRHRLETITSQTLTVNISSDEGMLCLLPSPVTCFRDASYHQKQIFRLAGGAGGDSDSGGGASLVLLDWLTSGRASIGEEWAFTRYGSLNEVWVGRRLVAKDVQLLDAQLVAGASRSGDGDGLESTTAVPPSRSLADTLRPYGCYAVLILYGPKVQDVIKRISEAYGRIVIFRQRRPEDLIWSFSPVDGGAGAVVRVAGKESELVKRWLRDALDGLKDMIGLDMYRRAFF